MSDRSANLSLPYIQPSQAQKHITHNEAVRRPVFLESSAPELLIGGVI